MSLMDILRKSEQLVYWNRCRLHCNNPEFRRLVLEGYQNPDFLEMQTHGREYEGKTIYLIEERGAGVGFFAEFGVTLIELYFADERGFTPYVRWGRDYLYYEPDGVDGEQNAFLYFFKPVSEVKDIAHACHMIRTEESHYVQVKAQFGAVSYDVSDEYVDAMARMVKKYIYYNERTKEYLQQEYSALLGDGKVLGVHFRGTDFRKGYNNHPIPVQIEQEIDKVQELLDRSGYDKIFLATDEKAAVERFQKVFGDKVYIYEDTFRDEGTDESIAFSEDKRDKHRYHLAREVVRDQYTLTHCDGLVCGYSNVTFIARVMRQAWFDRSWEDFVLIDNGLYHNSNAFSQSSNSRKRKRK